MQKFNSGRILGLSVNFIFVLLIVFVNHDAYALEQNSNLDNIIPTKTNSTLIDGLFLAIIPTSLGIITIIITRKVANIRKSDHQFKKKQAEIEIVRGLTELFHESINLVYSKQVSFIREIVQEFSEDEDENETFPGTVEPIPKYIKFNRTDGDKGPSDILEERYKQFRTSLEEQRDKQYLFYAEINLYADEHPEFEFVNNFIHLRKNARLMTYFVRKIYESNTDIELAERIEQFYINLKQELDEQVNIYARFLSNELKLKPLLCVIGEEMDKDL